MKALKEMKIWLCWKYSKGKSGKITKVPFSVYGTATGTDEKHRNSWGTYEQAVQSSKQLHASGIGFVLPEGYCFLDLDHKDLQGTEVQKMLRRFNSYAEKSPSGEGLHILGMVDLKKLPVFTDKDGKYKLDRQYYMKNPNNDTELYFGGLTNRFATFTGNAVQDMPLADCTEAVLTTLDKDMRRSEPKKYSPKRDGSKSDFDIICGLRKQKNGDKFIRLYDKGDFSDYGSQSEADLALCTMLAWRTGGNESKIDELFRCSALYRPKWEREDYRSETIRKAIKGCQGQFYAPKYKGITINRPTPKWFYFDKNDNPRVSATKLAQTIKSKIIYKLVRDSGKQAMLIYVYENGVYKLYAPDMFKAIIKNEISGFDEHIVKMRDVNETYLLLTTELDYISQDELNSREDIINFENGLLVVTADDLKLIPHTPDILTTVQIPSKWTGELKDTHCFDKYLSDLTSGNKNTQTLLCEVIGAVISNVKCWRMKKSLFLVGMGDTGKSVAKTLTETLIGKGNYIGIDLKEIEARFGTGAIYNTRLAGSSDMSFLSVDELKTFKKITGGDSLFAEFKGQQAFEYVYNGFLWFCMNRLPKFGGDDGKWVYDRIMIIECNNPIPPEKQDKQLTDKLYAEREGIIYKAVRALQMVIKNGYRFSETEEIQNARTAYMNENNTVISFFEECMIKRDSIRDNATTGRIYDVYKAWCADNNHGYAKTAKEFRDTLSNFLDSPYEKLISHTKAGNFYTNYTLSIETKKQYVKAYGYDYTDEFMS